MKYNFVPPVTVKKKIILDAVECSVKTTAHMNRIYDISDSEFNLFY